MLAARSAGGDARFLQCADGAPPPRRHSHERSVARAPAAHDRAARRSRGHARGLEGAFRRALLDGAGGARAAWPRRIADRRAAARGRRLLREHRRCRCRRQARRPPCRAGDSLRRRLVARRPSARGAGWRLDRSVAHEQGDRGQRRGPDRDGAGRRHAHAGERRDPPHRSLLSDRPRRRRVDRRHVRDACQRHERGALRHDARERARPDRGHGARRDHPHRHAGAQIVGRLRPDAADGRQRRNARRDDRDHAARLSAARGDVGGDLHFSVDRRRGAHDDRDHPDGRSDRALRAARSLRRAGREPARQAVAHRSADAADGIPRQRRRRRRAGEDGAGDRQRARRRGLPVGDDARGSQEAVDGAPSRLLRRACR